MYLTETNALMRRLVSEGKLDTYAIAAGINGEKGLITSENADRDTYFDLASTGKVLVTSTLALHAMGEGRLTLRDTISKFYPEAPEDKREITLLHLLTHTSGMTQQPVSWELGHQGSDAIAAHLLRQKLQCVPGSRYVYSSDGLTMVGFILEKIYGAPLDELYRRYITEPLGLTRSRFNVPLDEPNAAVCYSDVQHPRLNRADDLVVYNIEGCVYGGGGSFSSVGDVETFVQAVFDRSEVLYPQWLYDLAEKDYTPDFSEGRGLGYWIGDSRNGENTALFPKDSLTFGHVGSTGQSFFMNRKGNLYVILLTNYSRFSGYQGTGRSYEEYMANFAALRTEIYRHIEKDMSAQGLLPAQK